MPLDSQKELTPVIYGNSAVKILPPFRIERDSLCFAAHWHERMELILIEDGTLTLQIGERTVEAQAGALAIVPPERPHSGRTTTSAVTYHTMMFDVQSFYNQTHAVRQLLPPIVQQRVDFLPVTRDPQIVGLMRELLAEPDEKDDLTPLFIIGRVYELLGLLYRRCRTETQPVPPTADRMQQVIDYIAAHSGEDIGSASLSRLFGYDEAYFCRRFRAATGLSPMQYIRILRLEQARRRLEETDDRIADIAAACGFADAGYFTRCFGQHFGLSPKQHRLRAKQAQEN